MTTMSTPDATQSEAFVATAALFLIFGSSVKEEKVFLRLPAQWRELWTEFAEVKKDLADEADRNAIREFRDSIRDKREREEEDGVVLTRAFKKRGALLTPSDTENESGPEKSNRTSLSPDTLRSIWFEKCSTPSYQMMLVSESIVRPWCRTNNCNSNHVCNFLCGSLKKRSCEI